MKIVIDLGEADTRRLAYIAERGLASSGHRQTFQFVIYRAVEEFINKYLVDQCPHFPVDDRNAAGAFKKCAVCDKYLGSVDEEGIGDRPE